MGNISINRDYKMASSEEPITIADVTVEDESSSEPSAERKTSTGSGDIQLSSIQVIVRGRSCGDAGDEDSEEEEEEEEKPKKKKKVTKRKKSNGKPEPTAAEVLTKTLAQALRLINEQRRKKNKRKERRPSDKWLWPKKRRWSHWGPQESSCTVNKAKLICTVESELVHD